MGDGMGEMNTWALFKAGGPIMVPIFLCSIFAFGIVIEKLYYFSIIRTDVAALKRQIFDLVKNNKIKEAVQICDSHRSPVAKILKAGMIRFGASRDEIKESMEEAGLFEVPKLESRMNALATIAHISPLLGLLGTAMGMATIFHTIEIRVDSLNPVTPGDLAGGVWEALLTTVAGLIVAIPSFVTYNYCVNHINHVVLEMERGATELINFMCRLTEIRT